MNILPRCCYRAQPVPKTNTMKCPVAMAIITSIVSSSPTPGSKLIIYNNISKLQCINNKHLMIINAAKHYQLGDIEHNKFHIQLVDYSSGHLEALVIGSPGWM